MIPKHQLVAILFADICGYTIMMGQNEEEALLKLNQFKQILQFQVARFCGDIKQFYGDGCLIIFHSDCDAVNCASSLQKIFLQQLKLPVRMGIHSGEVLVKEDNVLGDAVNIASRIESVGVPGSVLVSKSIYDQIKNKPGFQFVSLGKIAFKNVSDPKEIFALTAPDLKVPLRKDLRGRFETFFPKIQIPMRFFLQLIFILILIAVIAWKTLP